MPATAPVHLLILDTTQSPPTYRPLEVGDLAGGGGGGGSGSSNTTEATQLQVRDAAQSIDGKTPNLEAGRIPVALPAGLATEATAAAILGALPADPLRGADLGVVAPVSAAEWLTKLGTPTLRAGSFITYLSGANGSACLEVSHSPLTYGEDIIPFGLTVQDDLRTIALDYAIAGRMRADLPSVEMVGGAEDAAIAPVQIAAAYQCSALDSAAYNASPGAYLTAVLSTPLPASVSAGDLVSFSGLADNRLDYPNCALRYISADRMTICVGYSDAAVLPSLAVTLTPAAGTAYLLAYRTAAHQHAVGVRFDASTATTSTAFVRAGADCRVSGASTTDHRVTMASSASSYQLGHYGQFDIRPTSRLVIAADADGTMVGDTQADLLAPTAARMRWTAVTPTGSLSLRVRNTLPVGASRAAAKIVSAVHAAASTATVVTLDITPTAAGLAVGRYVTLRGVANQTVFANSASGAPITAIDDAAKTITLAWGTATAASSYGGTVVLQSGSIDLPGVMTGAVQSAAYNSGTGILTLASSVVWAFGVAGGAGDHVDLHGVRDAAGADLGLDGCWRIHHMTGTTLLLEPVANINGARISPQRATLASTPAGGTVIQRCVTRVHRVYARSAPSQVVQIDGAGTTDASKSLPVYGMGGSITSTQGPAAALGTNGGGAWIVRAGAARTVDIASAAITASSTSSAVDQSGNNGAYQVTFDVTAVSGTTPRMYPRVQESFDGGTNWVTTYDLPPVVNSTDKTHFTPVLPVLGTHVRYVRTLTGTTPSFTNSVTRTSRPLENPPQRRQLVDRVVSLTATTPSTDLLYVDGCRKGQIVLTLGTVTTAPALKLQVCDDISAGGWYDVPGATLTGQSAATVASAIFDLPPAKMARLVPTTAGAGVTADTYTLLLKAWG